MIKETTLGLGKATKCMGEESSSGQTVANTRVTTLMTRKREMEPLLGQMDANMKEAGRTVNNMALDAILQLLVKEEKENGTTGQESNGWTNVVIMKYKLINIQVIHHSSSILK